MLRSRRVSSRPAVQSSSEPCFLGLLNPVHLLRVDTPYKVVRSRVEGSLSFPLSRCFLAALAQATGLHWIDIPISSISSVWTHRCHPCTTPCLRARLRDVAFSFGAWGHSSSQLHPIRLGSSSPVRCRTTISLRCRPGALKDLWAGTVSFHHDEHRKIRMSCCIGAPRAD